MKRALLAAITLIIARALPTPIAPEGSILDSLFSGVYELSPDIYYDLRNEGYYSPKVFEGYVHRPVAELAASAYFKLDVKLFGLLHLDFSTQFNLLKLKVGL